MMEANSGFATAQKTRILLIDDDDELCHLVSQYLRGRGFIVDSVGDGETGLTRSETGLYDLLVLDVMLPGLNGFEILRQLRFKGGETLPIIMLTAHGDEIDRIVGLELGADDYLPKPFNPRELLARIKAVLRRGADAAEIEPNQLPLSAPAGSSLNGAHGDSHLQVGEILMDIGGRSLRCGGEVIELTATEFDLLLVLLRRVGHAVSREELSREALGRRLLPLDRSLDLHMSRLRRKLGPKADGSERVKTLRGIGYLMPRDEPSGGRSL